MENMGSIVTLFHLGYWLNYLLWVTLYILLIIACFIGWRQKSNSGFMLVLIASAISLLNYIPSMLFVPGISRTFTDLTNPKMQEVLSAYYVIKGAASIISMVLMVVGMFLIVRQKKKAPETENQENSDK